MNAVSPPLRGLFRARFRPRPASFPFRPPAPKSGPSGVKARDGGPPGRPKWSGPGDLPDAVHGPSGAAAPWRTSPAFASNPATAGGAPWFGFCYRVRAVPLAHVGRRADRTGSDIPAGDDGGGPETLSGCQEVPDRRGAFPGGPRRAGRCGRAARRCTASRKPIRAIGSRRSAERFAQFRRRARARRRPRTLSPVRANGRVIARSIRSAPAGGFRAASGRITRPAGVRDGGPWAAPGPIPSRSAGNRRSHRPHKAIRERSPYLTTWDSGGKSRDPRGGSRRRSLNEGRGVNPGDTRALRSSRSALTALNEGRA